MEQLKELFNAKRDAQKAFDHKAGERAKLNDRVTKGEQISDDAVIAADVAYWKALRVSSAADEAYHTACKEYVEEM